MANAPVHLTSSPTPESERRTISSGGAYESIFGYSRAVAVGNQIHVSGTCAPPGHEDSDAYTQAQAALSIIAGTLADLGSGMEDVVRTVVYVCDMGDADQVARAHSEVFDAIRPASTLVQVVSLLRPWFRVEIEAYAVTK